MSSLKERLRSSSMAAKDNSRDIDDDSQFTLALMQEFQQECVVAQLKMALRQVVAP